MADLLANQEAKQVSIFRGQEVEGEVISIFEKEIILDLGTKAEGILSKKDLPVEKAESIKVGDKIIAYVMATESENGQVILGMNKAVGRIGSPQNKFLKFEGAVKSAQVFNAKALEVNKGGLMVEVGGVRGFLPSSQVSLSQAANLDELVGKELQLIVLEVDPKQNRLIFSQKTNISDDIKSKLNTLKGGDEVSGEVAAVLPFGIFVTLPGGVEGLVHISELSWEKVEDPSSLFKLGDKVSAKVVSSDTNSGRVNLSIKQLQKDPFEEKTKDIKEDDVIKAKVTKVSSQGIYLEITEGVEGFILSAKLENETQYLLGESISCMVDSIDSQKRRVNLVPFITSTKDLIYK